MAHLVETMAYKGQTPWHGLGTIVDKDTSIEMWVQAAGLDWKADKKEVYLENGRQIPGFKALMRSDNGKVLSIMSDKYRPVQPIEILEFYRDLTQDLGFVLETAGSLKAGRKIWALAKTPNTVTLPGGDEVQGYFLLATSLDGTLSTVVKPTSVRVVCNNTLQISLSQDKHGVSISHRTRFNPQKVKETLGLMTNSWGIFSDVVNVLATRKVTATEVADFFGKVVFKTDDTTKIKKGIQSKKGQQIIQAIKHSPGASLPSAQGTAWGLLNGLTNWLDYTASRTADNRLNSSWFGRGAEMKQDAFTFLAGLREEKQEVYEVTENFFRTL